MFLFLQYTFNFLLKFIRLAIDIYIYLHWIVTWTEILTLAGHPKSLPALMDTEGPRVGVALRQHEPLLTPVLDLTPPREPQDPLRVVKGSLHVGRRTAGLCEIND